MLTALNSSGEKVSGWDAKKEDEYKVYGFWSRRSRWSTLPSFLGIVMEKNI